MGGLLKSHLYAVGADAGTESACSSKHYLDGAFDGVCGNGQRQHCEGLRAVRLVIAVHADGHVTNLTLEQLRDGCGLPRCIGTDSCIGLSLSLLSRRRAHLPPCHLLTNIWLVAVLVCPKDCFVCLFVLFRFGVTFFRSSCSMLRRNSSSSCASCWQ